MTENLYSTLGIDPSSTPEQIKRAYRKKARETHPDKPGGTDAAFASVARAWLVLRDPERRAKYDRDGDPDAAIDQPFAKMMSLMVQTMFAMIEQVEIESTDLIKELGRRMKDVLAAIDVVQLNHRRSIAKFQKVRSRISFSGQLDVLGFALDRQIAETEIAIAKNEEERKAPQDVIEYIKHYKYKFDMPSNPFEQLKKQGFFTNFPS